MLYLSTPPAISRTADCCDGNGADPVAWICTVAGVEPLPPHISDTRGNTPLSGLIILEKHCFTQVLCSLVLAKRCLASGVYYRSSNEKIPCYSHYVDLQVKNPQASSPCFFFSSSSLHAHMYTLQATSFILLILHHYDYSAASICPSSRLSNQHSSNEHPSQRSGTWAACAMSWGTLDCGDHLPRSGNRSIHHSINTYSRPFQHPARRCCLT